MFNRKYFYDALYKGISLKTFIKTVELTHIYRSEC